MNKAENNLKEDKNKRNILIGGAWPYANSSLHLGHLAALISGDFLKRYHELLGDTVLYVSGTDCHGTPITERAKREGTEPKDIAERYHKEFKEVFNKMNFSYSLYTKTCDEYHKKHVEEMFLKMYENQYIYSKKTEQPYCEHCCKFKADRELELICPNCGQVTKGDQCDCGYVPIEDDLIGATCRECGNKTIQKENTHLYLALSKFQKTIEQYAKEKQENWRIASKNETEKYLKEGLKDRAVTRDLSWGVDIPIEGFEDKKMYVWIDAVLGYVTATQYLNINSEKISKSKGNGITILQMVEDYNVDSLRYYMISHGPENKDVDFTIENYVNVHNSDIVNKFGNFVNRTLKFKGLDKIPLGNMDEQISKKINETYEETSKYIESLEFKKACNKIVELIEIGNKYYDERKPWIQKKENIEQFNNTIYTCANVIANLSNLLEPIMPETSKKLREYLKIEEASWKQIQIKEEISLENIEILFERIDINR